MSDPHAPQPQGRTADRLSLYVNRLKRLRADLDLRKRDIEHAAAGRIAYFFDANVVGLFLEPSSASHAVRIFNVDNTDLLETELAVVTAEVLFSSALPGQRGLPLITADHALDLMSMANGVARKARTSQPIDKATEDEIRKKVEHFRETYDSFRDNRPGGQQKEEWLRRVRASVRPLLSPLAGQSYKELIRLSRIYSEPPLVENAHLLPEFTADIIEPDPALVADWADRIQKSRLRRTEQRLRRIEDRSADDEEEIRPIQIYRDAVSLTQVQLLNRDADRNRQRYVLVTCDEGLRDAYEEWYGATGRDQGELFSLRHPRQFMPFSSIDVETIEELAESAIKDGHDNAPVLDNISARIIHIADNLLYGFGAPQQVDTAAMQDASIASGQAVEDIGTSIAHLRSDWNSLCDNTIMANLDTLVKHVLPETDFLSEILSGADVSQRLRDKVERILTDVDKRHLTIGAQGTVLRYVRSARSYAKHESTTIAPRAPLAIKSHALQQFIGVTDVNQYLQSLLVPENNIELRRLQTAIAERGGYLGPFFAACVCLRTSEMAAARQFARGALGNIRSITGRGVSLTEPGNQNEDRFELTYIDALSSRFLLRDISEYHRTSAKLRSCLKFHSHHRQLVRAIRARSELAALGLTVLSASRFQWPDHLKLSQDRQGDILKEVAKGLGQCQTELAKVKRTRHSEMLFRAVEMQVLLNRVQVAIIANLFPPVPGAADEPAALISLLESLKSRLSDSEDFADPIVDINLSMAEWIASKGGPNYRRNGETAERTIERYLAKRTNLSQQDKLEMRAYLAAIYAALPDIN